MEGNCREEVTITVADKSEISELCKGDERACEEYQRTDPIVSKSTRLFLLLFGMK